MACKLITTQSAVEDYLLMKDSTKFKVLDQQICIVNLKEKLSDYFKDLDRLDQEDSTIEIGSL
jgi:hypothetical protein